MLTIWKLAELTELETKFLDRFFLDQFHSLISRQQVADRQVVDPSDRHSFEPSTIWTFKIKTMIECLNCKLPSNRFVHRPSVRGIQAVTSDHDSLIRSNTANDDVTGRRQVHFRHYLNGLVVVRCRLQSLKRAIDFNLEFQNCSRAYIEQWSSSFFSFKKSSLI